MALYLSVSGTITGIEAASSGEAAPGDCSLLFSILDEVQGPVSVLLSANTYVMNLHPFLIGERATFFYRSDAPALLIFPPRFEAAAAAYTPIGVSAVLDYFTRDLTNSDGTLTLSHTWPNPAILPNGQPYSGAAGGHLLLVTYSKVTRSIPPQASPDQIVVFC